MKESGQSSAQARRQFAARLQAAIDHYQGEGKPENPRYQATWASKKWNVTRESVRKWLASEALPQLARIIEIAKDLGVRSEWLISGDGEMLGSDTTASRTQGEPDWEALVQAIEEVENAANDPDLEKEIDITARIKALSICEIYRRIINRKSVNKSAVSRIVELVVNNK